MLGMRRRLTPAHGNADGKDQHTQAVLHVQHRRYWNTATRLTLRVCTLQATTHASQEASDVIYSVITWKMNRIITFKIKLTTTLPVQPPHRKLRPPPPCSSYSAVAHQQPPQNEQNTVHTNVLHSPTFLPHKC